VTIAAVFFYYACFRFRFYHVSIIPPVLH